MLSGASLEDKYALDAARAYMTGIEALVRLPMLQRQRDAERGLDTAGFISGYRGSPLGGLDQALWKAQPWLDRHRIVFRPAVNEDLAATAVWGSQQVGLFEGARHDGVFAMWYGKGPGVDRSMDVIRHANAFGVARHGGVLAVAGDDHAAKSSTLPHQSEHLFIGASIPVLNPAGVQEVLDLGVCGWELSRYCGTWVALKAITDNMDSSISAEIDPGRVHIRHPEDFELPADGVHARWPDAPLDQERRLNRYKIYAARAFARANRLNRVVLDSDRARLGIITTGKAYLDVMQALEDLGIDRDKAGRIGLRVLKVGMSWPLEPVATHEFAEGLEEILVVEEKRSIIEDQLTGQLYNWPVERRPRVVGEFDERGRDLLTNLSELTPAMVARAVAGRLGRFYSDEAIAERLAFYERKERALAAGPAAQRMPHYCSGCPHSRSTRIPDGSLALGGIGCHYMGIWEEGDRRAVTFTQMGGEGAAWVGQAPFTDTPHAFQNMGDGTWFHSGVLAVRQAVAADVNITYKILYNDAVAMTGGQPVDGELSVERVVRQLRAEGVRRVAVVAEEPSRHRRLAKEPGITVGPRDDMPAVQRELRELPGVTAIVYDQVCAAEKRRRRKRGLMPQGPQTVLINPEVCEGCGDCGVESNCLSVAPLETELGRKRRIDQNSCNRDYSCLRGFCPSFATVSGGRPARARPRTPLSALPEPPPPAVAPVGERPWNIVVTGVGGTGVLTVASVTAMAAHLEGKGCATMNQTGLAQKFGAVVSHVRVGRDQSAINAVRIPTGDADLLLGCDLAVAAGEEAVVRLHPDRSRAVVNDAAAVSAELIADPDAAPPEEAMRALIAAESSRAAFVPAAGLAARLSGDPIAANMFLLGYAQQAGLLPVSVAAVRRAIELNGVAVDFNLEAHAWGRQAAVDLERVRRAAGMPPPFRRLERLEDIVADRAARLADYQSRDWAARYRARVERLRRAERGLDRDFALSRAAARSLYALMALKDEYEVARLYTDGRFARQLRESFEGKVRIRLHLAPPLLARRDGSGAPRKMRFPGAVALPLFRLLAALRFLRGTAFDVFGWSAERRSERAELTDFERLLGRLEREVNGSNYRSAVELAELPQAVRGFGHVRAAARRRADARRGELLARFEAETGAVASDAGAAA